MRSSRGSRWAMRSRTVRPPTPESNTPMARSLPMPFFGPHALSRGGPDAREQNTEQAWCEVAPGSLILKEIALKEKAGLVKAGLVLALVSLLAGCVGQPRPAAPPATAAGPQLSRPRPIPDHDLVLTWGTGERFLVVVEKSCRRLKVYSHGRLLKSYPAVFGRRKGRKIHEG